MKFVTWDSAAANMKARRLLAREYQRMLFESCKAHLVNFVVKDVLKNAKTVEVCVKASKVITYFHQSISALVNLRVRQKEFENRTIAMSKLTDTRWYSYYYSYKAILDSKRSLRLRYVHEDFVEFLPLFQALALTNEIRDDVAPIVDDTEFWTNLDLAVFILEAIVKAQGVLESDACNLADVTESSGNLYCCFSILEDEVLSETLVLSLEDRWKRFFTIDLMLLAGALNPQLKQTAFPPEKAISWELLAGIACRHYQKFVSQAPVTLVVSIVSFKNMEGPFAQTFVKQLKKPSFFWQLVDHEHGELRNLAVLVLSASVHAVFIERFWSR